MGGRVKKYSAEAVLGAANVCLCEHDKYKVSIGVVSSNSFSVAGSA